MDSIVTVHYSIPNSVVNKVVGRLARDHIKAINAFCKLDGVMDDKSKEDIVNDELDWSGNQNGEGYFDPNDTAFNDTVVKSFQTLLKQKETITKKFKESTGMKIYLVYNDCDRDQSQIDGYSWCIAWSSLFTRTPAYKKFAKQYNTTADFSTVVKYC